MTRDDDRLAQASRALRHRAGLSQADVVGRGRSRWIPRHIEDGRAGDLPLNQIRTYFEKLGGRVRVSAWFEGALLDRLIDAEHAPIVDSGIATLRDFGWTHADPEVTFNEWGERGSIDFFGAHQPARVVLVGEAKSAWGSIEETLRSLDVKARLAPVIAMKRYSWQPLAVGVVLAFPEGAPSRRIAQRYSATLLSAFPARNREIKSWLRKPSGPLRGLWFLSDGHASVPRRG